MVQSLEVTALALPVANGIVHELELGDISKIADGEHRLKHGLQTGVVPFTGKTVHLQKPIIGPFLDLNQVWNLDGGWNLGKIKTIAKSVILVRHSRNSQSSAQFRRLRQ